MNGRTEKDMEKKNYKGLRILLIVIAVILIALIAARAWLGGLLGKSNYVKDDDVQIDGVDMSMNASTVYATADTPEGGQVQYKIAMNRDGIGWKINGVDLYFASQN